MRGQQLSFEELFQMEDPSATALIDAALAGLMGKPLSGTRRVVGMEMFEFGAQLPFTNRYGIADTSGEYALHVQCPWRIVRGGTLVVGYDDLHEDAPDPPPDSADTESDRNLRDVLLGRFLADGNRHVVTGCETRATGDVRLTLDDDAVLELFPAAAADGFEYWRLLLPNGGSVVMSGAGLDQVGTPNDRS